MRRRESREALAWFQAIVDRRGANWGPEYAAAHVGLARAAAAAGDMVRAKQAYEAFFGLWAQADADALLLGIARREYAALN